jgi:hypothetical protein
LRSKEERRRDVEANGLARTIQSKINSYLIIMNIGENYKERKMKHRKKYMLEQKIDERVNQNRITKIEIRSKDNNP